MPFFRVMAFIIFLNQAPVYWTSKKQNGVECGTFGSELTALKHCCEYIKGLRYKLRMMGIVLNQPTYIYSDNQAVTINTTIPESVLRKKNYSLAYHFIRQGVARGEWMITYIRSEDNCSDTLTKTIPSGEKRMRLISHYLFDIYDKF